MAQQKSRSARVLTIEYMATTALVRDPRNARKHTKKQIVKLAAAVREFGFVNPILLDEGRVIIAGHARLDAALEAGLETVPCVTINGLSEAQKRALAIADNKIHDDSTFDLEILKRELEGLGAIDFQVELTGFDTAEIDVLFDATQTVEAKIDPADAVPSVDEGAPFVSALGDMWLMDRHRLLCGNALDEASFETLLGSERAHLVFCDMPYNVAIAGHVSGRGKARHGEFQMASSEMSGPEFTEF